MKPQPTCRSPRPRQVELQLRQSRDAARAHRRPKTPLDEIVKDLLGLLVIREPATPPIEGHADDDDLRIFLGVIIVLGGDEGNVLHLADLHPAEVDLAADVQSGDRIVVVGLAQHFAAPVADSPEIDERTENRHRPQDQRQPHLRITRMIVVSHGPLPC